MKWCICEFRKVEAVCWEGTILLSNQMVFQVDKTGSLYSVSGYVELHVEKGFLRCFLEFE